MSSEAASTSGVRKLKVVLLGEGAVGKTSLVLRYVQNQFNSRHHQTLQASFMVKKLNFAGRRVEVHMWDTAGQERFHALGPIYYRDAQGAVLVFDVTEAPSFEKVKMWVKELRRMVGEDVELAIAGNKADLGTGTERAVSEAEARAYADSVGAAYHNTSAKEGIGVDALFNGLAKRAAAKADASDAANGTSNAGRRPNLLVADDDEHSQDERRKRKCC